MHAFRFLLSCLPGLLCLSMAAGHPAVMTHGGAGSGRGEEKLGTDRAARRGLEVLKRGGSALEAAMAAVVDLENDPRYNAGTGSNIRLDGRTIQMDAAVMDGATGGFGAVAAMERVKNPVLVARKVMDSPHVLIVGEGATRFARAMGFPEYDPTCKENLARYERVKRILAGKGQSRGGDTSAWEGYDWKKAWNFPTPLEEVVRGIQGSSDTVGAVARDREGRFAAAISTGGTTITFYGRVGDVPMYGCGIYAGPKGAVACTGHGEEIIKRTLARTAYEWMAQGMSPQAAVDRAIRLFPGNVGVGLIAIGKKGLGGGCNLGGAKRYRDNMAWSVAD